MRPVCAACCGGGSWCVSAWWCVWTHVCTWCSEAATQQPPHQSSSPVRFRHHVLAEAPGPIHLFIMASISKKRGDTGALIAMFLRSRPPLSPVFLFLHFSRIYPSAPPLVYHLVSSNNASSQFTSHLSLSCAHTLSSPSYYVVSVRFADGVISMKTGGQRRTAIFHIYGFWYLGGQSHRWHRK